MGEQRKPLNVSSNLNRISRTSLIDNVIYPFSHQYHYIQYYQQEAQPPGGAGGVGESANVYHHPAFQQVMMTPCQCRCSCADQQQQQQRQQQQQQLERRTFSGLKNDQHQISNNIDGQRVAVIVHRQASGSASSNELNITSNTLASNLDTGAGESTMPLTEKAQSATSLLDHSYQALKMSGCLDFQLHNGDEDRDGLACASEEGQDNLNVNISDNCNCDLECTCSEGILSTLHSHNNNQKITINKGNKDNNKNMKNNGNSKKNILAMSEAMLTADEITVSESDNNSATVQRCERNQTKKLKLNESHHLNGNSSTISSSLRTSNRSNKSSHNTKNSTNRIDMCGDGDQPNIAIESCLMDKKNCTLPASLGDLRPPLPPRPTPRPAQTLSSLSNGTLHGRAGPVFKKYVIWCLVCGGFSCILGFLFLGVYFLLHSYTITVGNFETVPTFVPASLLILTGLCVITLARRRNRYNYLIKISGLCGLISALTCALVTVTTTVLHMSRLQALRECEYAQKTRTCTCYSDQVVESSSSSTDRGERGVRLVFDSLSDCGVVHGSLYSCLRVIFGLSVAGVLVAVFSCMLVYQLLSHERKKMYWEQLELRCRSLYTRQPMPPANMEALGVVNGCRCCEQCHAHRQAVLSSAAFQWNNGGESRFWSTQPPGNFYSPNPGGDQELNAHELPTTRGRGMGWSWHRLWQRNLPVADAHVRFQQTTSSPDSQYGFTNSNVATGGNARPAPASGTTNGVVAGATTTTNLQSTVPGNNGEGEAHANCSTAFQMVGGESLPYGVWGPPPPYSDPNSPASRGYYHYIQPLNISGSCAANNHNNQNNNNTGNGNGNGEGTMINFRDEISSYNTNNNNNCHPSLTSGQLQPLSVSCPSTPSSSSSTVERLTYNNNNSSRSYKVKASYANTPSESDGGCGGDDGIRDGCSMATNGIRGERDRFSNTLPTRKMKKRPSETGHKSVGSNSQSTARVSVQQVFSNMGKRVPSNLGQERINEERTISMNKYPNHSKETRDITKDHEDMDNDHHHHHQDDKGHTRNHCRNTVHADQLASKGGNHSLELIQDPSESEVYFADVSSCCNMSVKNDHFYEETHGSHKSPPIGQKQDCGQNGKEDKDNNNTCCNVGNEDYLAQRFGQRENSIRSRLPFPQNTENFKQPNLVTSQPLAKDISLQSMCPSLESDVKTEFTDLSPLTPTLNVIQQQTQLTDYEKAANSGKEPEMELDRETNRSVTEAHYEVIDDDGTTQELRPDSNSDVTEGVMSSCLRVPGNYHHQTHLHLHSTTHHLHPHHSNSHALIMNWQKDLNSGNNGDLLHTSQQQQQQQQHQQHPRHGQHNYFLHQHQHQHHHHAHHHYQQPQQQQQQQQQ